MAKTGFLVKCITEKRWEGVMIHIETIMYIILAIFCIYLLIDGIGDKKREEYLEKIAILKRAINKSKKRK